MVNVSPHDSAPDSSNDPEPASFVAGEAGEAGKAETPDVGRGAFDRELCDLVADTAPALFAVCEEVAVDTDTADGWVVAWGIVCADGQTYAMPADSHRMAMSLASPERALWWFGGWRGAGVRLVWLNRAGSATFDASQATARSAA
jgi:hypothetical protein